MPDDLGKPGGEGTFLDPSKITEIEVGVGVDESGTDQMSRVTSHFDAGRLPDRLGASHCDDGLTVQKHGPRRMDREGICDDGSLNEVRMIQI